MINYADTSGYTCCQINISANGGFIEGGGLFEKYTLGRGHIRGGLFDGGQFGFICFSIRVKFRISRQKGHFTWGGGVVF